MSHLACSLYVELLTYEVIYRPRPVHGADIGVPGTRGGGGALRFE